MFKFLKAIFQDLKNFFQLSDLNSDYYNKYTSEIDRYRGEYYEGFDFTYLAYYAVIEGKEILTIEPYNSKKPIPENEDYVIGNVQAIMEFQKMHHEK